MTNPSTAPDRVTWRFRLVACCLVLVAAAFTQRPGRLVGDTKLDLVVDPGGMLARSLHLWDPQGGFGQVQNQAYGYLFPMGPFFWVGDLLSVPGWAVQRAWWSLLLVVAFLGVVKLSGALGLGSPTSRILAGFAYALSPRILTLLGPISVEAWPSAIAPWVLVPLVLGTTKGSPRSAALLSAVAVACAGGVNAAATFAVIPLGVVWLLTRQPGPRRRSLMTWWPLFVLVGTAWWLVPLVLLGRYSPPFLDYIETASVTTFPTTLYDALRGTSHWVPYVDPTWQAGNDLISTSYLALNSGVLLLFGVVGMTLRKNPHRQFLVISTFLGLLVVTAGHGGALQGWFGGLERHALDGVLAPLRNVHKFDAVIRLPLVLGLAHLVSVMGARAAGAVAGARRQSDVVGERVAYAGVLLLCVVSVAGAASPALTGRLGPTNDFESVPGYWARTAAWLDENSEDTTAVLVPGSSFGFYLWGDADDEPLQPLASSPWAVRNAVPLAPAGNIRMLDALEAQLASGRPSVGLAGYLRRAGIGHLVVRNDLRDVDQPAPVLVHQALDGSPGVRRVAEFGPRLGNPARLSGKRRDTVVDDGWTSRYPAVEIYEVSDAHRAVVATGSPLVVGGPEDLLGLTETGLLGDAPTVLAVDAPEDGDADGLMLTDGLRRRETNFARIEDGKSATLEGTDRGRRGAPARDYTLGERAMGDPGPHPGGSQRVGLVVPCVRRHARRGAAGDVAVRRLRRVARHCVGVRPPGGPASVGRDRVRPPPRRGQRRRGDRRDPRRRGRGGTRARRDGRRTEQGRHGTARPGGEDAASAREDLRAEGRQRRGPGARAQGRRDPGARGRRGPHPGAAPGACSLGSARLDPAVLDCWLAGGLCRRRRGRALRGRAWPGRGGAGCHRPDDPSRRGCRLRRLRHGRAGRRAGTPGPDPA